MFIFMVYNFRERAIIPSVDPALFPNVQIPTQRNYVSSRLSINQAKYLLSRFIEYYEHNARI